MFVHLRRPQAEQLVHSLIDPRERLKERLDARSRQSPQVLLLSIKCRGGEHVQA